MKTLASNFYILILVLFPIITIGQENSNNRTYDIVIDSLTDWGVKDLTIVDELLIIYEIPLRKFQGVKDLDLYSELKFNEVDSLDKFLLFIALYSGEKKEERFEIILFTEEYNVVVNKQLIKKYTPKEYKLLIKIESLGIQRCILQVTIDDITIHEEEVNLDFTINKDWCLRIFTNIEVVDINKFKFKIIK